VLIGYRTASGAAHVTGAWCPHLGSDLSVRGRIVGESIQCAFHGWQFQPDGCADRRASPQAGKATLRQLTAVERNGVVHVWLHPRGAPPSWEIPAMSPRPGTTIERLRRVPMLALVEQAFDHGHFEHIHSLRVNREAVRVEESGSELSIHLEAELPVGPLAVPIVFDVRQLGPSLSVFELKSGPISLHLYTAYAPQGAGRCRTFLCATLSPGGPALGRLALSRAALFSIQHFFDAQDGDILEARNYAAPPSYGPLDGALVHLRRWLTSLRDDASEGAPRRRLPIQPAESRCLRADGHAAHGATLADRRPRRLGRAGDRLGCLPGPVRAPPDVGAPGALGSAPDLRRDRSRAPDRQCPRWTGPAHAGHRDLRDRLRPRGVARAPARGAPSRGCTSVNVRREKRVDDDVPP
jgi:nitrite reductase/ring-hydroxylating ferredoxin subunit